jgi:hypothetical protein
MDVPYKLPSNVEFETSYAVFKASRGCLARGIPSRESIEPSDPIQWVRAPPSEPLRGLYVMCLRTTSQPLSSGAWTST